MLQEGTFPLFPHFSLPVLSLGTSAILSQCIKGPVLISGAHAWEAAVQLMGVLTTPDPHPPEPTSALLLPSIHLPASTLGYFSLF